MSRIEVRHDTPSGTEAYAAYLYFDDGQYPNAEVEHHGYWTTEEEAWDAIHAALKDKPGRVPSEVEPGNTAVWLGQPEMGAFLKDADDEWFTEPSFEPNDDYDVTPVYKDED